MDIFRKDDRFSTTRLLSKPKIEIQKYKKQEDKFQTVLFLPDDRGVKYEGGLRTKGYFKYSYEKKNSAWYIYDNNSIGKEIDIEYYEFDKLPLITVITVVFNSEKYIEQTILSVLNQTYDNVEYIIIDGGSTDGTIGIIKKYEHAIDYWVSEKDEGIYDAMNKGISISNGKWINLLNSGDTLNGYNVFKNIGLYFDNIDIFYSDTVFLIRHQKKIWKSDIKKRLFIHQSIIYLKSLHDKYGKYLNIPNVTISDYLFFSNIFIQARLKKINDPISIYRVDGISSNTKHFYQKLAVDLMCGYNTPFKVGLTILIYPFYKTVKKFFIFLFKR